MFRYYQAGVANTLFGFGLYSAFVWFGLDIYLAQILSHLAGMAFNYLTYSRYAFAGQRVSKINFIASYAINYFVSLVVLAGFDQVTDNPYVAGLLTIVVVSITNYFVLKRFVFKLPEAT